MKPPRHRDIERARKRFTLLALAAAITLTVAGLVLAGCGGSSSLIPTTSSTAAASSSTGSSKAYSSSTSTAAGAVTNRPHGANTVAGHSTGSPAATNDTVTRGTVVHRPKHGTGGAAVNDDNPATKASRADSGKGTAVSQVNPCALVPKADAESIIGAPLDVPRVAPLGPTCIYQPRGAKNSITLSVEAINFSQIKPHMRKVTQVQVRGHAGYCGEYGQPMTFVPLPNGEVLNVTAPCSVGALLAAEAISRLTA
jgi:hypothetical protein